MILVLMLSIRGYLWIEDLSGTGNEGLVQVIHQYSWIGLTALYAIVVAHGIVLFECFTWAQLHENIPGSSDAIGLPDPAGRKT